jgi:hypothetical protein
MNRVYFKDVVKNRRDRFLYNAAFALGTLQKAILARLDEPLWRSQDGRVGTSRSFKSKHLRNIVALLEREGETDDPFYRAALDELSRRKRTSS